MPLNKKGVLVADEDGYYTHPLGGLNVFNSAGEYYTYEGARNLFESSSSFMRKVNSGQLYGENGHPEWTKGMTEDEYLYRYLKVQEDNICHHIAEIWLDMDNVKDASGQTVITIMGKVRPEGKVKHVLEQAIVNPRVNTCFSIRAFTDDKRRGGINMRTLTSVVTFDKVGSPGIATATKYNSPSLESFMEKEVKREMFLPLILPQEKKIVTATEADRSFGLEVFQQLGFNVDGTDLPSWSKW
jgi:hypothetical protein